MRVFLEKRLVQSLQLPPTACFPTLGALCCADWQGPAVDPQILCFGFRARSCRSPFWIRTLSHTNPPKQKSYSYIVLSCCKHNQLYSVAPYQTNRLSKSHSARCYSNRHWLPWQGSSRKHGSGLHLLKWYYYYLAGLKGAHERLIAQRISETCCEEISTNWPIRVQSLPGPF